MTSLTATPAPSPGGRAGRAALPAALRKRRRREGRIALAFMSPWLLGFCIFFAYPLLAAVYFSFYYYNQFNPPTWAGLTYWKYVFTQDPDLVTALKNTLWLVVVMVVLQTVFALGVSLLITKIKQGGNFFRTLFYLPYLAPPVISTLIFVYMFDVGGPVDTVLGHLGIHNPPLWFNDPAWFKPSLTVLSLWGIGNTVVIFFASLLDVPKEQLEAAQLDGAGAIKRFRYVTLPAISPVILFSVVTGVIFTMQYYTQALVAGQVASGQMATPGTQLQLGYPLGSSLTIPQLIYQYGAIDSNTAPACIVSILLFLMTMLFTLVLLRRKSGFMGGD